MKNLNKQKTKKEILQMMIEDDLDYSIYAFKNLRKDLINVFLKYANFDVEKFKLNLKLMKNSKMLILVDLEVDGLFNVK